MDKPFQTTQPRKILNYFYERGGIRIVFRDAALKNYFERTPQRITTREHLEQLFALFAD